MNQADVERVLKLRSSLTSQPYGPQVIAAWTEALSGVTEHDAKRIMHILAERGERELTIPAIRNQLRLEQRNARQTAEAAPTVEPVLKFKANDPTDVAARRAWNASGRPGHYPGCPCESCIRSRP